MSGTKLVEGPAPSMLVAIVYAPWAATGHENMRSSEPYPTMAGYLRTNDSGGQSLSTRLALPDQIISIWSSGRASASTTLV